MMSKISLITFDLTNTLIRVKNSIGFEYLKIANIYCNKSLIKRNLSQIQTENQLSKAFKTVWKDMNNYHPNYGLKSGMSSHQWWSQVVKRTFRLAEYSDNEINDKQLDIISTHLFKLYSSANLWSMDENCHKVLTYLKTNHFKIGIVSNFDERLDHILHELGLRHFFDFVLISRVVKCCKPSKEMFELIQKTAKLVNPSEGLHIGDDLVLDYLWAKSFGLNSLLYLRDKSVLNERQLSEVNQKDIISDLSQLINHKIFKF